MSLVTVQNSTSVIVTVMVGEYTTVTIMKMLESFVQIVNMVFLFVWLMDRLSVMVEWRYTIMVTGVQYVMQRGGGLMQL